MVSVAFSRRGPDGRKVCVSFFLKRQSNQYIPKVNNGSRVGFGNTEEQQPSESPFPQLSKQPFALSAGSQVGVRVWNLGVFRSGMVQVNFSYLTWHYCRNEG